MKYTDYQLKEILDKHKKWLHKERGGKRANLSGADLSDICSYGIEANLSGADLSGTYLVRVNLRGANLSGANLSGANLEQANLPDTNLSNANLSRAYLARAYLARANLSGADLSDADLSGADLSGANLSDANLSDASLYASDLAAVVMADARLLGADLSGANLDYASWPLWCGSIDVGIDKRIAAQLLYHALRAMQSCANDADVAAVLASKPCLRLANKFHRVRECGRINTTTKGENNGQQRQQKHRKPKC